MQIHSLRFPSEKPYKNTQIAVSLRTGSGSQRVMQEKTDTGALQEDPPAENSPLRYDSGFYSPVFCDKSEEETLSWQRFYSYRDSNVQYNNMQSNAKGLYERVLYDSLLQCVTVVQQSRQYNIMI